MENLDSIGNEDIFWNGVAANLAADDVRLNQAVGSILLDLPLSEDEGPDYSDMKEYLFNRYGLFRQGDFDTAFDLCEDRIIAKLNSSH